MILVLFTFRAMITCIARHTNTMIFILFVIRDAAVVILQGFLEQGIYSKQKLSVNSGIVVASMYEEIREC